MTLAEYRKRRPQDYELDASAEGHEPGGHAHPGPGEYLRIGFALLIVTTVEVALYYAGFGKTMLLATMLPLSLLKFSLVVMWFMHLRFDNRLFWQLFVGGLLLAVAVFLVAVVTLGGKLV